ncbi:MAG: hypothetical protein ABFR36_08745 [Acidobacteriota bacterium]
MKRLLIILFLSAMVFTVYGDTIRLKPYILAGIETGEAENVIIKVEELLTTNEFKILGKYSPMKASDRTVIVATHKILTDPVEKIGGLTAFASVIRFGILKNGDNFEITYTNPLYWGNAYYRKKFPDVESGYNKLNGLLINIFKSLQKVENTPYGSKKGVKIKKLRKYHYMAFMPYFDNVKKLAKKTDYNSVIAKIEENLNKKKGGVEKVYRIDFPDQNITLFGGALYGKDGESKFIPKIDKKDPRHVTFMPYEFLVMKDRVVMLHGRFRIALSFPDLKMGTFMKIMSTPGNIADYFKDLTK